MGVPRISFRLACIDTSVRTIRFLVILRAGIVAIAASLHVLASVLAFIVYGLHHSLDPAPIFTSLALFNMLRMPLMFFRKPICTCFYVLNLILNPDSRRLEHQCGRLQRPQSYSRGLRSRIPA